MTCPRCLGSDITGLTCNACRLAYPGAVYLTERTKEHIAARARWQKWRGVDRAANETRRVAAFLGNGNE